MATFCSFIKCLKSTCEIVFYCICWLKFCNLYMKKTVSQGSVTEVLHKIGVLKNFSKFTGKRKRQSSGLVLKNLQNSQKTALVDSLF